ncbi:MAG: flagellar hook capping FlgD N-terminal domain-containing protein [Syntrophales bacterium]
MSDSTTVNGIDNIIEQYSSSNATKTSKTQSMGKEDFLKMLVAQLKNQDPLNPMSGTDFATQLAQFSSLEQLTNLNNGITNLGLYQSSQANLQAVNLIGKEVTAGKGNGFIAEGSPVNLYYDLSEDAKEVKINIYDEAGVLADTVSAYDQAEGVNNLTWNNGQGKSGNFTFKVFAFDTTGATLPVDTLVSGKVTAVSFKDKSIYVNVAGQELPFSEVREVKG